MPAGAFRVVTQIQNQDDFAGPLTSGYFLSYNGTDFVLAPAAASVALDDLTDVTLTSVAQGDILYRGASQWNNLGPGTAGYALTTNGAGANPAWANIASAGASIGSPIPGGTVGSVLFVGAGPVFAQDNANFFWDDTDNMLLLAATPAASAVKASLRLGAAISGGSANGTFLGMNAGSGFTGDFIHVQTNGVKRFTVNQHGHLFLAADGNDQALIILGAADASHVGIASVSSELHVYNGIFTTFTTVRCGSIMANGTLQAVGVSSQIGINRRDNDAQAWALYSQSGEFNLFDGAAVATRWQLAVSTSILNHTVVDSATNSVTAAHLLSHNSSGTPATGFGSELRFQLQSSTTVNQAAGALSFEWATATDASRKARGKLTAWDTAVREAIRWEASGSAPMVGFLGSAAVVQQTLTAAATDPATTQALANSIRTALINLGLAA